MKEDIINKIVHGDSLQIMKELPDGFADLVLTDPPYGVSSKAEMRGSRTKKYGNQMNEWDKKPSDEYFDQIFRVSKNQIIWGMNYFSLPPTRCFNVWKKFIPEKFSMSMCELAWTSFNKNAKIWEADQRAKDRFHPTQKPLPLIIRQLEEYSKEGDLVLDPFSGSATTAIACLALNRRYICIEAYDLYYDLSVKRVEEYKKQKRLATLNNEEN